jgi:quinolinate synthase
MKMITPEKLLRCLQTGRDEVIVPPEIADRARIPIERMISIL